MNKLREYVSKIANSRIGKPLIVGVAGLAALVATSTKADADVFGKVIDYSGTPIPRVTVLVTDALGQRHNMETDVNGVYHLTGFNGAGGSLQIFECYSNQYCALSKTGISDGAQKPYALMKCNDGIFDINSQDEWNKFREGKITSANPNGILQYGEENLPILVYLDPTSVPPVDKTLLETHIGGLDPSDDPHAYPGSIEDVRGKDIYEQTYVYKRDGSHPGINVKMGSTNSTSPFPNPLAPPELANVVWANVTLSSLQSWNMPDIHNEFCQDANALGSVSYESALKSTGPSPITLRDASHIERMRQAHILERASDLGNTLFELYYWQDCRIGVEESSWGKIKALYK